MKRVITIYGLIAVAVLASLLAFSGARAAAPQSITISEVEFKLTPNTFTVEAGQPVQVTVTNNGTIQHNLAFQLPSKNIEKTLFATNLNPGETRMVEFTFTDAGDWVVFCPIPGHEAAGMKGVVHVTAAAMANATMAPTRAATPMAHAPAALPTTGGDQSWVLLAGAFGVLLIVSGILFGARARLH